MIIYSIYLQPALAPVRGGADGAQRRPGKVPRPRQGRALQTAVLPLLKSDFEELEGISVGLRHVP